MLSQPENYAEIVSNAFVNARLQCLGLKEYPDRKPGSLTEAYMVQDKAIRQWPHAVAGWKVGGISDEYAQSLGASKLAGPIFENQIFKHAYSPLAMPVFKEGFSAVEGEIVIIVKSDTPSGKVNWTLEEAENYIGRVHIGVEIASSPFEMINEHGPLVTISDFGNNNGLIIGDSLSDWREDQKKAWTVETIIEGRLVGRSSPPGPLSSFRFMLENAARRDMPLKAGMAISTGAITGVHRAYAGQLCTVKCSHVNDINLMLVPASAN